MVAVAIVRGTPGGVDEYGDPVTSTSSSVPVPNLGVAPRKSEESGERGRAGVVIGKTVYLPAGTDIRSSDQLLIDGELYDVEGEPGMWENPLTGHSPGIEVAARRAVG